MKEILYNLGCKIHKGKIINDGMHMTGSSDNMSKLPEYDSPPVIEVYFAIQFELLPSLTMARMGQFWLTIQEDYPLTSNQPRLEETLEYFGPPSERRISVEVSDAVPTPRLWMVSSDENWLLQLQDNRLVYNWRASENKSEYPRYNEIKEKFFKLKELFWKFCDDELSIIPAVKQCDITYLNIIEKNNVWKSHSDIKTVFPIWNDNFEPPLHAKIENANFAISSVIGGDKPYARHRLTMTPRYKKETWESVFHLTNSFKGRPKSTKNRDVEKFFDEGHEYIVLSFDNFTSGTMHKIWGKKK